MNMDMSGYLGSALVIIGGFLIWGQKDIEHYWVYGLFGGMTDHILKQGAAGDSDTFEGARMGIEVLQSEHDGKRGWVWVELWSVYHPDGSLREAPGRALWSIEKEGLQWKIRYIDEGLKGRQWLWR